MRPGNSGEEVAVRPGQRAQTGTALLLGGRGVAEVKPYRGGGGSRTGSMGSGQVEIFAGKDEI